MFRRTLPSSLLFPCWGGLYYVLHRKISMQKPANFIKVAVWVVWTCLLFLPAMHERYGHILDILLLAMVFVDLKYSFYFGITLMASSVTYGAYLFSLGYNIQFLALAYTAAYLLFSYALVNECRGQRDRCE